MHEGEAEGTPQARFALREPLIPLGCWQRWRADDLREQTAAVVSRLLADPGRLALGADRRPTTRMFDLARLRHPAIARVLAMGHDAQGPWIAEELGRARPLVDPEARVPRGRALVSSLLNMLEAIAYLHRNGAVHGRLSGETLVSDGATLQVIASALADGDLAPDAAEDVRAWAHIAGTLLDEDASATSAGTILREAVRSIGPVVPDAGQLASELRRAIAMADAQRERIKPIGRTEANAGGAGAESRIRGLIGSVGIGLLTVALTVGALLGAIALGTMVFLDRLPREVQVPSIIGLTQEEASAQLSQSGLDLGEIRRVYSDDVTAGEVAGSLPEPGMAVRQGREVVVIVSLGAARVIVPRLVGLQLDEAKQVVAKAGLELSPGGSTQSQSPLGEIVRQDPASGTRAARGDRVKVITSGGADYGSLALQGDSGESERIVFRTLDITIPQGESLQRVKILEGYGDTLEITYDRLHRPGDRIKFETRGRSGKQIQVTIEGVRVYQTQL